MNNQDPALQSFNRPIEYLKHTIKSGFKGAIKGALIIGAVVGAVALATMIAFPGAAVIGTGVSWLLGKVGIDVAGFALAAVGKALIGGAILGGGIGLGMGAINADQAVAEKEQQRVEGFERTLMRNNQREMMEYRMNAMRTQMGAGMDVAAPNLGMGQQKEMQLG